MVVASLLKIGWEIVADCGFPFLRRDSGEHVS